MVKNTLRRAAFLVTPHAGGIFTVYLNLRAALLPQGISVEWVGGSHDPDALRADPRFFESMQWGHLLDARGISPTKLGRAILQKIVDQSMDLVFINVLTGPEEMAVAAYLPPEVSRVMIVHNITPGTYRAAKTLIPFVHASAAVSPRIYDDLIHKLHAPAARTFCTPNCQDPAPYRHLTRQTRSGPLRLLSLGRVVDTDKGVFWLPDILRQIAHLDCSLTVAGDGPDLPEAKQRCGPFGSRVSFLGRIAGSAVPALATSHDLLLMPSRFEGFGYTLIEAMAGGCVPIATRMQGVTDFVVKDGETGFLFPMGDVAAAASHIRRIHGDAGLFERLSLAARQDVDIRFSIDALSKSYAPVLEFLRQKPVTTQSKYGLPFELLQTASPWRKLVPNRLKNLWRKHFSK